MLDFTNTFVLECDASKKVLGSILMQEERPLEFTSNCVIRTLGSLPMRNK